ncbi:hypothetical protein D5086_012965 [Populus alba]|uniref:Flavin-containing monooxygenase n=2 Tax=Populus alba TaxID=43335 RepID=A0A4U5QQE4_POPAL|nr:flavin-containing monooxygenase family protein [Populus alba]
MLNSGEPGEYGSLLPGLPVWEVAVQSKQSDTIQYGDIPKIPEFPLKKGPEVFKGKVECNYPRITASLTRKRLLNCTKERRWQSLAFKTNQLLIFSSLSALRQTKVLKGNRAPWLLGHYIGLCPITGWQSCQKISFLRQTRGRLCSKKTSKWWFNKEGLEFEDNTKVEADVVIFATGFDGKRKLKDILPDPFCSLLEDARSGVMPLYRGTVHPLIPNMAFLGFIESVANLHTSELRSIWLARLIDNKFKLPTIDKMLEQVSKEIEIAKRTTRFYKRHCISTFSINHK